VIHDNVPGGAGHTAELLSQGQNWLHEARDVLWHDENHHARCEHGCLDCVLIYDVMFDVTAARLRRRAACEALDGLLPLKHRTKASPTSITSDQPITNSGNQRPSREKRKQRLK
jgi:hypothetical protein